MNKCLNRELTTRINSVWQTTAEQRNGSRLVELVDWVVTKIEYWRYLRVNRLGVEVEHNHLTLCECEWDY